MRGTTSRSRIYCPIEANIRYNLALAALHTERYVLAARLMHETLATCGTPCPTKIQETTSTRLQEAEAHVGRIRVQTTGAVRILIDGESVDQKVAQNVWHVSPGKHDVVVESGRTSQTTRVEVPAGQLSIVDFRLDDPAEERTEDTPESAAAAAMISWVVTGALGLATAAGYFLWPDAQAHRAQRIVPIASGEFHGLMLQGAF